MSHPRRHHIHLPTRLGDRIADAVAPALGSWPAIALHTAVFVGWFVAHADINLLTNIVSLESIYLTLFVLQSQYRQSAKDQVRDDTEAHEVEELYVINKRQLSILEMLHELQQALDEHIRRTPPG